MRMKKRLALLLAAVMLVGLLPTAALAADDGDGGDTGSGQVTMLHLDFQGIENTSIASGVFTYPNGTVSYTHNGTQYDGTNKDVEYGEDTEIVITLTPANGYTASLEVGGHTVTLVDGGNGTFAYTFTLKNGNPNNGVVSVSPIFSNNNAGGGDNPGEGDEGGGGNEGGNQGEGGDTGSGQVTMLHLDFQGIDNSSIASGVFTYPHGTVTYTHNGTPYDGTNKDVEYGEDTEIVITLTPANGYTASLQVGGQTVELTGGGNGTFAYTFTLKNGNPNNGVVSVSPIFSNNNAGGGDNPGEGDEGGGGNEGGNQGDGGDTGSGQVTMLHLDFQGIENTSIASGVFTYPNGTVSYTHGGEAYTGTIKDVEYPEDTQIVITLTPETGYTASLQVGGQTVELTGGGNGTFAYTFTLKNGNPNNGVVSVSPIFSNNNAGGGDNPGEGGDDQEPNWYTVSWGGGNVTVKNGQVIAERIHGKNDEGENITYTKNLDEVNAEENIFSADILQDERDEDGNMTCSSVDKYGFGYGDTDLFIRKGISGVTIDFKFIPDYGYQLKNIYTNEDQTDSCLDKFSTGDEISNFAFAVIAGGNVHFCVSFQAVNNTATVQGSGVSAATVDATGIASGTLNMTVAAQETKDVSATQEGTAVKTVDITLDNVVSKGEGKDNWTTPISGFSGENKATVSLTIPGLEAGATYKVVREHDGEYPTVLDATYTGGKLTFESDKFSTYTIVKTADAPVYTPTLPPAVTTPTVTVPVSGDADSVKVTATVSGTTATVGSIKASDLDKIADAATEPVDVVIDLSGLDKTVNKATIPNNTFKNVARAASDEESGITGLEVKLTTATVTMDGATLSAVLEQAGSGSVTVAVAPTQTSSLNAEQRDAVQELTAPTVIDAYFQSGAKRIGSFEGGRVKLAVPYVLEPGKLVSVHYVDDEGALTPVEATYSVQDGTVTFFPPHFSYYVISADGVETPCDGGESCPAHAFSDVDTAQWYHEAVDYAIENGLMSGYGDGKFDPNGSLSRGMLCQILYNKEGRPAVTAENPFTDVPADQWYTDAVVWAYGNEIVAGYGDGTFGPDDDITREQLATILYRYEQVVNQGEFTGSWMFLLDFEDADLISDWASEAMHWMVMNGVIAGKGDSILDPLGKAQRCEVAQMLMNYLEK